MHHIQHNSFVMPNFTFNSVSISFISSSVRLYFCESLLSSVLIYKYVMLFLTCSFIVIIFTSRLKDMDRRRIAPPPAIRFVFQLCFFRNCSCPSDTGQNTNCAWSAHHRTFTSPTSVRATPLLEYHYL